MTMSPLFTPFQPLYRLRYSEITSGRKTAVNVFVINSCDTALQSRSERGWGDGPWLIWRHPTRRTSRPFPARHRALSNALPPPQLKPPGGILSGNACCATHAHAQDLCSPLLALRGGVDMLSITVGAVLLKQMPAADQQTGKIVWKHSVHLGGEVCVDRETLPRAASGLMDHRRIYPVQIEPASRLEISETNIRGCTRFLLSISRLASGVALMLAYLMDCGMVTIKYYMGVRVFVDRVS